MTLESLRSEFDDNVSQLTGAAGRETLRQRLELCKQLSDSLITEIQSSQRRLNDLEGQQEEFYKLDKRIQQRLSDIESTVSYIESTVCINIVQHCI